MVASVTQATEVPERRTQAERTAGTQAKLLDAAIDCLVELGFAKTSTQEIARRAGVSRGAQLHHFPTKESLVTAAVGHLVEKRLAEILEADPDPDRGVEVLSEAFSEAIMGGATAIMGSRMTNESIELTVELARGLAVSALFRTPDADAALRARLLPVWESKVVTS